MYLSQREKKKKLRKEIIKMGGWLLWFQKDEVAGLEREKAKLLKKRVDIDEEIREIDEKIAKVKSEIQG